METVSNDNGFDLGALRKLAWNWKGPKSVCVCGHTGDESDGAGATQHGALNGHGPCKECGCKAFTWRRWTLAFGDALAKLRRRVS